MTTIATKSPLKTTPKAKTPTTQPKKTTPQTKKPPTYHSKGETVAHTTHYTVFGGEILAKGLHYLGHGVKFLGTAGKVLHKVLPGASIVSGVITLANGLKSAVDPFSSRDKSATQITSGLIQIVGAPLGLGASALATLVEKIGPNGEDEAKYVRAVLAKSGLAYDRRHIKTSNEFFVTMLARAEARPEEARKLVVEWTKNNTRNPLYGYDARIPAEQIDKIVAMYKAHLAKH